MASASKRLEINNFLRNPAVGRCETVTLRLGATATGFYPFGADLGDVGDFTVRVVDITQTGMLFSPMRHFNGKFNFLMVTAPAYSLPTEVAQGNFEIGDVDGLMPPQRDVESESIYNYRTDITRGGTPYSVDGATASDAYITNFDVYCNKSKAGALLAYLVSSSGRTSDIDVVADSFYMFGADVGASDTYSTKCLGSEYDETRIVYRIRHDGSDRFIMPLMFWAIDPSKKDFVLNRLLYKGSTFEWLYKTSTKELLYK
jgi:hypothetical protein